ncbi:hypothetical protein TI39_contig456g00014 [Zymoseptoria brevis]|uniref:Uncharacterized protein n=1 Tax=Zymoseptoria brevis TaxID=1047168 RepID=A0A0F4GKC3_9PEZI|nr:hypothetical protein TI39_contig456g00014 [Zymoseptoria brevis]
MAGTAADVTVGMAELEICDRHSEHAVGNTVGSAYFDGKTDELYAFAFEPTGMKAGSLDDETWTEVETMLCLVDLHLSASAPASATVQDRQLSMIPVRLAMLREMVAGAKQARAKIPAMKEAMAAAEKDWDTARKKDWIERDPGEITRLALALGVKKAVLAAAESASANCGRQLKIFAERVKPMAALRAEQRKQDDGTDRNAFVRCEILKWREKQVSLCVASLEYDELFKWLRPPDC